MITKQVTEAKLMEWKKIWLEYKDILKPNRKSGEKVLAYLQEKYQLIEIFDKEKLDTITYNVMNTIHYKEKLKNHALPIARAFLLENTLKNKAPNNGNSSTEDKDMIFIGIDMLSGYYMVEGSEILYDEICAFVGLDKKDIDNYVCVALYVNSVNRCK